MYTQFFQLRQAPFSIAPDPHYLFMSERHREALAHLLYGLDSGGGFVLLTGEIGAGKTTICRCLLEQVPPDCNVAYIFNPKLSVPELLRSVCDEFGIEGISGIGGNSIKDYVDALNRFLLEAHAQGRNNVLIIDEAQNLSSDVLEQLRLLTNLETNARKLLQIILIGQPELRDMVAEPQLEQLAQRMIARYHLGPLSEPEANAYIQHRMMTAGHSGPLPFDAGALRRIYKITSGVPRRINLLCDRALLAAYAQNTTHVDARMVRLAAAEIFGKGKSSQGPAAYKIAAGLAFAAGVAALGISTAAFMRPPPAVQPVKISKPGVAPPQAMGDMASLLLQLPTGEAPVLGILLQQWQVNVTGTDPCSAAPGAGLHCYRSNGGLAELRSLDRPAVITLQDAAGTQRYALLTGLGINSASLRIGDMTHVVSALALARYFQGSFTTVWRAPQGFSGPIGPGEKGPAADWVATRLDVPPLSSTPNAEYAYGLALVRAVREFQVTQGLKADGVAGPKTLMYLNRAAGIEEPRLQILADARAK